MKTTQFKNNLRRLVAKAVPTAKTTPTTTQKKIIQLHEQPVAILHTCKTQYILDKGNIFSWGKSHVHDVRATTKSRHF